MKDVEMAEFCDEQALLHEELADLVVSPTIIFEIGKIEA